MVKMSYKFFFSCLIVSSVYQLNAQQDTGQTRGLSEIAFASDTQAPIWVESIFLDNNHNRKATALVFADIIKRKPNALFILGDIVSMGHNHRTWRAIDKYVDSTRQKGIPVYALLGNHELMQRPKEGEANFQKRFPEHIRTGYCRTVDSIAIVLLNSNFSTLTKADIAKQHKWLHDTLAAIDSNAAIRAVIVTCHHPPYSNSRLVGSSVAVQQQFVKPFLQSTKSQLFITGHSHAFEYFQMEGKDFLIIGGGGGLHHPLRKGEKTLKDVSKTYKPMFHYITIRIDDNKLYVISHQLKPDFSGFEDGFNFKIPLE